MPKNIDKEQQITNFRQQFSTVILLRSLLRLSKSLSTYQGTEPSDGEVIFSSFLTIDIGWTLSKKTFSV
jgi:hypothetical protein